MKEKPQKEENNLQKYFESNYEKVLTTIIHLLEIQENVKIDYTIIE